MPTRKHNAEQWRQSNTLATKMEAAALERIVAAGLTHKRVIACDDCCAACQGNKDQGAIPVGAPFVSGHMHAPFCSKCRCATVGARMPV
jgi:uridine phosphorylase